TSLDIVVNSCVDFSVDIGVNVDVISDMDIGVVADMNVGVEDEVLYEGEISCENTKAITIEKGQSFNDFDQAVEYIRKYAKYMGFKIILKRNTTIQTNEDKKKCHNADTPARGFITILFTLGIESTSFVESQNACLKRIIKSSNTSLYELRKVLIDSGESNIRQKQYEDLVSSIPSNINTITIFPQIELFINHIPVNKPSKSDNFKDEPDSVFLCAQFLLQQLDYTKIEE
ncbi:33009_t:CDS:2, partial [Racocetra persica]